MKTLLRSIFRSARTPAHGGPGALLHPQSDPESVFRAWYREARSAHEERQSSAMSLATCGEDGRPSARIVVCKAVETEPLALIFFTRHSTRKAVQLAQNPHAAALFYWPETQRQARIEGHAMRLSGAENRSRFPILSLTPRRGLDFVNASRGALCQQQPASAITSETATTEGWGGYRLVADSIELWISRGGLAHTSVRWIRDPLNQWIAEKSAPPSMPD